MRSILTATALAVTLVGGLAAQDRIYKVGEGIKSPVITKEVKPRYTPDAMRRKVEGSVELDAVILKDGTVGDVTVKRSLDEDLDVQAIKALKQWTFRPGTKDGEPVAVQVMVELTFHLK